MVRHHRTVLEVEIVSYNDRKTWFVFEVELDGETPISQGFWNEESSGFKIDEYISDNLCGVYSSRDGQGGRGPRLLTKSWSSRPFLPLSTALCQPRSFSLKKTAASHQAGHLPECWVWGIKVLGQIVQNNSHHNPEWYRTIKSIVICTVLPWLADNGTLRKEFEKNKLGNIRLRAVLLRSELFYRIDWLEKLGSHLNSQT